MTLEKRLKKIISSNKVERVGKDCYLYMGATVRGLPVIAIDGKLKSLIRVMVEFFNKKEILPESRCVNFCGNRRCINPQHSSISYKAWKPTWEGEPKPLIQNYLTGQWYRW